MLFFQCTLATRCAVMTCSFIALALNIHVFLLLPEAEGAILHMTRMVCRSGQNLYGRVHGVHQERISKSRPPEYSAPTYALLCPCSPTSAGSLSFKRSEYRFEPSTNFVLGGVHVKWC